MERFEATGEKIRETRLGSGVSGVLWVRTDRRDWIWVDGSGLVGHQLHQEVRAWD